VSKKILYITSSFPYGKSEVWAINELNSLQALGTKIYIIPRTGGGEIINKDALSFCSSVIDVPFVNQRIVVVLMRKMLFSPFFLLGLFTNIVRQSNNVVDVFKGLFILPKSLFLGEILENEKLDHIHSFSTTSAAVMAYMLSSMLKVPWSYTIHTSEKFNSKFRRSLIFHSRSASICRAISQRTADDWITFVGSKLAEKMVVVHLGVAIPESCLEKAAFNDPIILATPAELTLRKGHVYALEAAKKLLDSGLSNFKWYFFGSGPLLHVLQEKIADLGLSNHCYFPGIIDHSDLLKKYEECEVDIVVMPSISVNVPEGIPVSLMEAMSYGIPVVATNNGATVELVDGITGLLINQCNSDEIFLALYELINNPGYSTALGKNGRDKVMQEFDTIQNALDLQKIF
jgi:glycosyltransferase involved in cell wall biosynthesis